MPRTRFEEWWPLPTESLPELPYNLNIVTQTLTLLANQLGCIDFLTPPTALINPHRLSAFLESLMPLKNGCSIHARCSKSSLKHSIRFCGIFSKFKTEFYSISFFKMSDCIFEIQQLWQSGFSRVHCNSSCSWWFKPEIIKICSAITYWIFKSQRQF